MAHGRELAAGSFTLWTQASVVFIHLKCLTLGKGSPQLKDQYLPFARWYPEGGDPDGGKQLLPLYLVENMYRSFDYDDIRLNNCGVASLSSKLLSLLWNFIVIVESRTVIVRLHCYRRNSYHDREIVSFSWKLVSLS